MLDQSEIDSFVAERTDIKRVDPEGCGCTDCLTGYSRPVNELSDDQLINFIRGQYYDASCSDAREIARWARDRGLVADNV